MNEKDFLKILGKTDSKYIEEASPTLKPRKKRTHIVWLSAAACIGSVIITAVAFHTGIFYKPSDGYIYTQKPSVGTHESNKTNSNTDKTDTKPNKDTDKIPEQSAKWPIKRVPAESSAEKVPVPKWEDLTLAQKYPTVQINDMEFSGQNAKLTKQTVGRELADVTATGFIGEAEKKADATAYAVIGIDERCAAAIKFDGSEEYYVYINSYYLPSTLGEFTDALSLEENIEFGAASYSYFENGAYKNIEFNDLDDSVIWDMLLSDRDAKSIDNYDSHDFTAEMTVGVSIPLLGYENIALSVTEDGYLITNILNTGKAFFIGKEKTEKFTDYVIDNCTGYEIVYVSDGEEIPE